MRRQQCPFTVPLTALLLVGLIVTIGVAVRVNAGAATISPTIPCEGIWCDADCEQVGGDWFCFCDKPGMACFEEMMGCSNIFPNHCCQYRAAIF